MSKYNIKFTKQEVQLAFEAMLKRAGGGFKFVEWFRDDFSLKNLDERSYLARRTDSDFATGLYASDYKHRSHITVFAGAIFLHDSVRVYADITFYEDEGDNVPELIGTSLGRLVGSFTEIIQDENYWEIEWKSWRLNRYLIILLNDLKKGVADF
jgi:hypothetical protein